MTLTQVVEELQKERDRAYATMCVTRSASQSAEAQGRHLAYGYALKLLEPLMPKTEAVAEEPPIQSNPHAAAFDVVNPKENISVDYGDDD